MRRLLKPLRSLAATPLIVACLAVNQAGAVVRAGEDATSLNEQTAEMRSVGRLRYSPLNVFGGCCVWIGDRWALTARHALSGWEVSSIRVEFPACGDQLYPAKAFYFPPNDRVDLALIELQESPPLDGPPRLDPRPPRAGDRLRLGGFGFGGLLGKPGRAGRFHWGENRLVSANRTTARFDFDPPAQAEPLEALPALLDSGSPVFTLRGGETALSGVSVRVTHGANPQRGDHAIMTCVASQRDWIQSLATEAQWEEQHNP